MTFEGERGTNHFFRFKFYFHGLLSDIGLLYLAPWPRDHEDTKVDFKLRSANFIFLYMQGAQDWTKQLYPIEKVLCL